MTRAGARMVWLTLGTLALAGAAAAFWAFAPRTTVYLTDAETIREPRASAPVRDVLWEPARALPPIVNSAGEEYEPRFSEDGNTLYFVRGRPGANADLYVSTRTHEGWTEPQVLDAINSPADELGPAPSLDGRDLYFYSDRAGGHGGYDLWVARRGESGWLAPVNLGPAVNSPFNDYGPAISPDGARLYFSSNRPRPDEAGPDPDAWRATVREDLYAHDYDLYACTVTGSGIGAAAPLAALNTVHNEGTPAVSHFGDFVYFSSDRPGGLGGFDLYRARLARGELRPPANLGSAINSPANDLDPALSMGGFALYFSSNRLTSGDGGDAPQYDLYRSFSREVFEEPHTRYASIDWAALLPWLWWLLLLALLALLLWLLSRALGTERFRRLGLLAKCLLISLLIHALILAGLAFWQVGSALEGLLRRASGTRVSLTSPRGADELTSQIRGLLSEAPVELATGAPEAARPEPQRDAPAIEPARFDAPEARLQPRVQAARPDTADAPDPSMETAQRAVEAPARDATDVATPATEAARARREQAIEVHRLADAEATSRPDVRAEAPAASRVELQAPATAQGAPRPLIEPAHAVEADVRLPESREASAPAPQTVQVAATPDAATPAPADSEAIPEVAAAPAGPLGVRPAPAAPAASTMVDLSPGRTAPVSAREISVQVHPTEASGAGLLATVERAPEPAELPPLTELTVPGTPDARAAGADEPVPSPALAEAAGSRAPLLRQDAPAATDSATVQVEPTRMSLESGGRSMARPVEATAESTLSPSVPAPAASLEVASRPAPALALPEDQPAQAAAAADRPFESPALGVLTRAEQPPAPAASQPSTPLVTLDVEPAAAAPRAVADPSVPVTEAPASMRSIPLASSTDPVPAPASLALRLPAETAPPDNPYRQRAPEVRRDLVERMGGSDETERAVAAALAWLARHQSPDGSWSTRGFDRNCRECGGHGRVDADVAATGLALLCFLAADHTHVKDGPYRDRAARAVEWLLRRQSQDGDLRGSETMYSHGIAAIALSEAYGMTRDERLRQPVERAVQFIVAARNTDSGGWRYEPGQYGDTSVLGWQVMALASARRAGLEVPQAAFDSATQWLRIASRASAPGLYSYQPDNPPSPAMTAEGLFVQQLLGQGREEPASLASVRHVMRHMPGPGADQSTYYWYYATLALFQHQGDDWRTWNEAIKRRLLDSQRRDGRAAGSWDVDDRWSRVGGRVYQTAICTLTLEVYYRYLPMYAEPNP